MLLGMGAGGGPALVTRACVQVVHAGPSCVRYLEGWGRPGSLLARGVKSSRRPGLAQGRSKHGVQLHLVGSEPPSSVTKSLWPPHRDKATQELEPMALLSLSPLGNRAKRTATSPRDLGCWGSTSPWMHTLLHTHRCISMHREPVQQALGQLVQSQPCPRDPAFAR